MDPCRRTRPVLATVMCMMVLALTAVPAPPLSAAPVASASVIDLPNPVGIAFRGEDLVVAAAGRGEVLSVAASGEQTTVISDLIPGVFTRGPTGVAVDGNGNVYVAVADDGVVLFATPGGTTGVYARGLGAPAGLAFDPAGNLYVADQAAHRVLRVSPEREISTVADGFDAAPYGVALSPAGVLHVSTLRDGRVWRATAAGIEEVAEVGDSAEGLAFDEAGNLYVGVGSAGEVVRLSPSGAVQAVVSNQSGPLNLAFLGNQLYVAAQGESPGGDGDRVVPLAMDVAGLPPATPELAPTALPEAPPHSVAHQPGAVALDPASFRELLPQAVATDVGRGAAEPTIGVTEEGNVFYKAEARVLRSNDQGLTWEDVGPPGGVNTTFDPYLYVDPVTSRVFSVDLYLGCSYLFFSDDEGETWIPNPVACGIPGNDHQTIAAGPTSLPTVGYPNALYYCYNGLVYSGCGRSLDGGVSFHPAGISSAQVVGECVASSLHGHLAVGPGGTVYLPKADCEGGPQVMISRDDGITWSQVLVADGLAGDHHEAHVAVDDAGNVYFLWVAGEDRLPYLSISRDQGQTWSEPAMVGPPGLTEANLPSIAAGDEGNIAIYYMGTSSDCCYAKRRGSETTWHSYVTVSVNALDDEPTLLTTTMNDTLDPLRRGTCGPGRCGDAILDFLEVVIDHDGRVWASLVDTCTGSCAEPGLTGTNNDNRGMVGQLVNGPTLRGNGLVEPPPWHGSS